MACFSHTTLVLLSSLKTLEYSQVPDSFGFPSVHQPVTCGMTPNIEGVSYLFAERVITSCMQERWRTSSSVWHR